MLVNFYIISHLNSPYFSKVNDKNLKEIVKDFKGAIYAIGNNSVIVMIERLKLLVMKNERSMADFI